MRIDVVFGDPVLTALLGGFLGVMLLGLVAEIGFTWVADLLLGRGAGAEVSEG